MWQTILQINNASWRWYITISIALQLLDGFTGKSLTQAGISFRALFSLVAVSIALQWYYKKTAVQETASVYYELFKNRLREAVFFGIGAVLVVWLVFWYAPGINVRGMVVQGGIPNWLALMFLPALFYFILIALIKENAGPFDDPAQEINFAPAIQAAYENQSAFPLLQYAHEAEYNSIIANIAPGETVLTADYSDGLLARMLIKKGARVTACDIAARAVAGAEKLPFPDNSFDWIISAHVLAHLPDFQKGLQEIKRVAKKQAIIALPTCLNPCAAVILGGDRFWTISWWSLFAWFIGLARIILNLGGDGIDEWRYPWIMRRELRRAGFHTIHFEASSLCLPYINKLIPLIKKLDRYKAAPIIRNFGYGSIAVIEK